MRQRVSLEDISMGVRFLSRLPSFLRRPIGVETAKTRLDCRFRNRDGNFLRLAKEAIYGNPLSPYLELLRMAGCQYGDLERLVRQEGLETALQALCAEGVFLTADEIKGRRPAVRRHGAFDLDPSRLRNPSTIAYIMTESGGSRTVIAGPTDLGIMEDESVNRGLNLFVRGGLDWTHAFWSVPGGAAIEEILGQSKFGVPPERWFVKLDPRASDLHPRYRWSARFMRWGSAMAGQPLPRPDHVPYDDPLPIIEWMRALLAAGKTPQLKAAVSSAVHLCRTALDRHLDIAGAQFIVSGEPVTETRLSQIRAAGAVPHPLYGSTETGVIAAGCLNPGCADDLHLFDDLHAVIQPGEQAPANLHPRALLFTSLQPKARQVLLNVSLGDTGFLDPAAAVAVSSASGGKRTSAIFGAARNSPREASPCWTQKSSRCWRKCCRRASGAALRITSWWRANATTAVPG